MFLKEIQQTKYRKIKLKQLLILFCRILLTIFLVLAFSKPFQRGYIPQAGEEVRSSVLLVLDDSFSMEAISDSGTVFDEAKRKLIETVNMLNDKDEIYFTTTSQIGRMDRKIFFENKEILIDSLKQIKISAITNALDYIMYYSNQILNSSSITFKELFLFTDGQKSTFTNLNNSESISINDENTKYNIILCGKRIAGNVSIDTINLTTRIFQKNKTIKLNCTLDNHNNFISTNNNLTLNIEGEKKPRDEKVVDIPANSSVDVEFAFVPERTGLGGGCIELTSSNATGSGKVDEFVNDNRRYFAYKIPDKIRLLVVCNSDVDVNFIKLALLSSEELMKDSTGSKSSYFDIKQVSGNELSNNLNNNFDCILISDKTSFNEQESARLYDYIQNGGGLLIYPGDKTDVSNYNTILFKKFDLSGINGTFGDKNKNDSFKFDKIDFDHPIFEGIFKTKEDNNTGLIKESPQIKFGFNLVGGINSIPLIKLNNENNFLVEYSSGKGKMLAFAVAPQMDYSDFPSRNIFPPITVRSILYLSSINSAKEAITGKEYFFDLSNYLINENDSLYIKEVDGSKRSSTIFLKNKNGIIDLKDFLNSNTNYMISYQENEIAEFPCNFDKRESIPDKLTEPEIRKIFETNFKVSPNIIPPGKEFSTALLAIRTGRELWKYFLIAALIFLLTEFILSRTMPKGQIENITKTKKD